MVDLGPQRQPGSGAFSGLQQSNIIVADTLAALTAGEEFRANAVGLKNLVDVPDEAGGLFAVNANSANSGLAEDGWDVINLTGVHAPKQLQRLSNFSGIMQLGAVDANNVVPLSGVAAGTAIMYDFDMFPFGCGPWIFPGGTNNATRRVQWTGSITNDLTRQAPQAIQGWDVKISGTPGDFIRCTPIYEAQLMATPNIDFAPGASIPVGGVLNLNGFQVNQLPYSSSIAPFQGPTVIAFQNDTGPRDVTTLTASWKWWRINGASGIFT